VHPFLRVTEVDLDGCQNDGRRKYVDINACNFVVNLPAVDSLLSAALPGHKTYIFLHKRSFRPLNHFSCHLNLTMSHSRRQPSPAKFRNRHPAHIMHLNIQPGLVRRETNGGYISALCNWESFSTKEEDNCIAFLLLISIYSFDFTSIQYQRLLWCLKHRRCVWSLRKGRRQFIF